MHEAGDMVFHRAAYFGPMLAHYQGMRRDEFCGLAVDDVIHVHKDFPYIHVGPNSIRRVKNLQSVRNLALHPELIRLGFLDYVDEMRLLGYERLFPDLYSAYTKSPVGDRYYDELLPLIKQQQLTPHQMRHYFGNTLKQKGVRAEHRADLLGHGGGDETTERYCEAIELEIQLGHLAKIPAVTADLILHSITPIPWVGKGEGAPWSRAHHDRIQGR
jgi:integrase